MMELARSRAESALAEKEKIVCSHDDQLAGKG